MGDKAKYIREETCIVCKKDVEAEVLCVECNKSMCSPCRVTHDVLLTNHHIYHINNTDTGETTVCLKHERGELVFYCKDCFMPVCRKCLESNHENHDNVNLQEYNETVKRELKEINMYFCDYVKDINSKILDVRTFIDGTVINIDTDIQGVYFKAKKLEDEIKEDFKSRCALPETHISKYTDLLTRVETGSECIAKALDFDLQGALQLFPEMKILCEEMKVYMPIISSYTIRKRVSEDLGKMVVFVGRSFQYSVDVETLDSKHASCSSKYLVGGVWWQIQVRKGESAKKFLTDLPSFDIGLSAFVDDEPEQIPVTSCETEVRFTLQFMWRDTYYANNPKTKVDNAVTKTYIHTFKPRSDNDRLLTTPRNSVSDLLWNVIKHSDRAIDGLSLEIDVKLSNLKAQRTVN